MARVVVDPNILVAALISPRGAPAALYGGLAGGRFELIASPQLLAELERVLSREKFRDPADDYLVALARAEGADAIVSGDKHLLELERPRPPVVTAREFVDEVVAVDAAPGGASGRG